MTTYLSWIMAGLLLAVLLFSTKNLLQDILAIISQIFQEAVKLAVTAVSFFLKIVSVFEMYLVLLIDIFSGNLKTTSLARLLSIALVALSVVSFSTTFYGMSFLELGNMSALIRACVTFGIQAIMLGTSLQIGKNSIVQDDNGTPADMRGAMPRLAAAAAAVLLYILVYFLDLGRKWEGFLYVSGCLLVVGCLLSLLPAIFKESCRNTRGTVLLAVYFSTLAVSSFFSYQTILNGIYSDRERLSDNVAIIAQEVTSLVKEAGGCFDEAYQAKAQTRLIDALDHLKGDMEGGTVYIDGDLKRVMESAAFRKYSGTIERLISEFDKSSTSSSRKMQIEERIQQEIGGAFQAEGLEVQGIQELRSILEYQGEQKACIGSISAALAALQKTEWDAATAQNCESACTQINAFLGTYLTVDQRVKVDPYLRDISGLLSATSAWKQYLATSKCLQQEILRLDTTRDNLDWESSIRVLSSQVQDLLESVPVYFQRFSEYSPSGENQGFWEAETSTASPAGLSLRLQAVTRSHKPARNGITRNLQAFVDVPQTAVFAALIAVLMDVLVLFAGMLLPKSILFFSNTPACAPNSKYSREELMEVLDNVFNKPVRESDGDE